jgi:hypothetical protein
VMVNSHSRASLVVVVEFQWLFVFVTSM